jgi:2-dehydropantoate 2-reductase
MKILVVGAGVLGSLYAVRLHAAGNTVTVLARGRRLAEIRKQGIILEDFGSGARIMAQVPAIGRLNPEDDFDLALVLVRKNQLDDVLPPLAHNPCIHNILFMFNNAAGPAEMIRAVGRERVLLGFPGGGGMRREGVVHFLQSGANGQPTTIGELDGSVSPRLLGIVRVFEEAGLPVQISANMDAWLKTHAAIISPMANAIYAAGGDRLRLARTRDALALLVRAAREQLRVVRALGIPITPARYRLLEWVPEPALVVLLQRAVKSERFGLAAVQHAVTARDEMEHIAGELRFLARVVGASTPAVDYLASFIDTDHPLIHDGQSDLPLEWVSLWRGLALLALVGALIGWLRRR